MRLGGQIPIQEKIVSGDKEQRTKLGSDPQPALAGAKAATALNQATSPPAQKQFIEVFDGDLAPGGAAVVALV